MVCYLKDCLVPVRWCAVYSGVFPNLITCLLAITAHGAMIVKTSNKGCNIAVIIDTMLTTENNIWHREINEDIET